MILTLFIYPFYFRIILFKCFLGLFLKHFWVIRIFFSFSCFGFLLAARVEYSIRSFYYHYHFISLMAYQEANRLEALYVKNFDGNTKEHVQNISNFRNLTWAWIADILQCVYAVFRTCKLAGNLNGETTFVRGCVALAPTVLL